MGLVSSAYSVHSLVFRSTVLEYFVGLSLLQYSQQTVRNVCASAPCGHKNRVLPPSFDLVGAAPCPCTLGLNIQTAQSIV